MPSKHSHPHLTGNDKGLYATMIGGRIDPWLYGDIRNLHLRFQQLYNHLFKNSIAQSYGFIFKPARDFCEKFMKK